MAKGGIVRGRVDFKAAFVVGECPAGLGATPVFMDVDEHTYIIDPVKLNEAIVKVRDEKNTARGGVDCSPKCRQKNKPLS